MNDTQAQAQIFKVQRSIVTTAHAPQWLIYNEDRSIEHELSDHEIGPDVKLNIGENYKAFMNLIVEGRNITWVSNASEQTW